MKGAGLNVYRGYATQRGYGLGNTLRALIRSALPIVSPIVKSAGKQLLMAGAKKLESKIKNKKTRTRKKIVPGKMVRKKTNRKPRDIFK
jgi:hypothetical protein